MGLKSNRNLSYRSLRINWSVDSDHRYVTKHPNVQIDASVIGYFVDSWYYLQDFQVLCMTVIKEVMTRSIAYYFCI